MTFFFRELSLTSSFPWVSRYLTGFVASITKRWFRIFVLCIVFFIVFVVERVVYLVFSLILLIVFVVFVSNFLARRRRSRTLFGRCCDDASDANVLRAKRESFPRPLFDASATPRRDPDSFDATSRPLVDAPTLLNVLVRLREPAIAPSTIAPFLPCATALKLVGAFFASWRALPGKR